MIRGWCPDLFTPMQSGDGWLVRVRPRRSVLSAGDGRAIADGAERFGNGIVELTNRGNVQIRGLTPASAGLFASAMVAAGVSDGRASHNLLASPLAGVDPLVHPQTVEVAGTLERALAAAGDLGGLPDKFLFVVDGGGVAGLRAVRADIAVRFATGRWAIWLDGEKLGAGCAVGSIADAVLGLARGFLAKGAGARRMRALVQSGGAGSLFRDAGLVADGAPDTDGDADWLGYRALGDGRGAFSLGVPFGQMRAEGLRDLADLSVRFADGALRITPWRAVLLAGVTQHREAALQSAAAAWITRDDDPRRRIVACPGSPGCASATVCARADAEILATIPLPSLVHVSGCGKGCAHPLPAPIALVGRDGVYDVVRDGRAGDTPFATGLTMAEAAQILMETV